MQSFGEKRKTCKKTLSLEGYYVYTGGNHFQLMGIQAADCPALILTPLNICLCNQLISLSGLAA